MKQLITLASILFLCGCSSVNKIHDKEKSSLDSLNVSKAISVSKENSDSFGASKSLDYDSSFVDKKQGNSIDVEFDTTKEPSTNISYSYKIGNKSISSPQKIRSVRFDDTNEDISDEVKQTQKIDTFDKNENIYTSSYKTDSVKVKKLSSGSQFSKQSTRFQWWWIVILVVVLAGAIYYKYKNNIL